MMEWIVSILGEDWLFYYIAMHLKYFLPLLVALLVLFVNERVAVNISTTLNLKEDTNAGQLLYSIWHSPLLKWRIRCLTNQSDDEDAILIY